MDWLDRSVIYFFIFIVFLTFIAFFSWIKYEYDFSQLPIEYVDCKLVSHNFNPSTRSYHVAPTYSSSTGMSSTTTYTTGHDESFISIWDCGKHGRLVSESKNVYRYGTENSVLMIRSNRFESRIVGIRVD